MKRIYVSILTISILYLISVIIKVTRLLYIIKNIIVIK